MHHTRSKREQVVGVLVSVRDEVCGSVVDCRAVNLGDVDDVQAEAIARELEDSAAKIRRGWRGVAPTLH